MISPHRSRLLITGALVGISLAQLAFSQTNRQGGQGATEPVPTAAGAAGPLIQSLSLVPAPVSLELCDGAFELNEKTAVMATPGTETEAECLASALRIPTGLPLPVSNQKAQSACIVLELDKSLEAKLGTEGYQLSVEPAGVVIRAAANAGLFYGGITFRQLLPPEIFGKSAAANVCWACQASN